MTYLTKGKWHAAKVQMAHLADERLSVESADSLNQRRPVNIQINQPVGISFKHDFGKYVFETTVLAFESLPFCLAKSKQQGSQGQCDGGGAIVLAVPQQMQIVQRRSYFRVQAPSSLKVRVLLWPRSPAHKINGDIYEKNRPQLNCCQGRLLDISAGGVQVVIPLQQTEETSAENQAGLVSDENCQAEVARPNFRKGQFVGIRFTPLPYEMPLTLSAQIRSILPTADNLGLSIGMQIVGLEASAEGHQLLTRLITVVGRYYQMNESGNRQRNNEAVSFVG
jgi:hypothetical protein